MNNPAETRRDTYEQGLHIRREVLGAAHVDNSMSNVSNFAKPIQDLVTEYCWGVTWSSDGLERKMRSLINLGILTALNRNHELGVHVRGAITNGATEDEIQEVLLQTAIYVGVPAALESFRVAEKVLEDLHRG